MKNVVKPLLSRPKNDSGMTLVELLLSVALLIFVLGAVYGLLVFSYNHLNENNRKVDAQFQMRYVMNLIKREAGSAGSVTIGNTLVGSGKYAYAGGDEEIDGRIYRTFMLYSGETEAAAIGCKPVEGFTVLFERADGRNNILHVTLTASYGYTLESDIYIQNLPAGGQIEGSESGSVLSFNPV